MLPAQILGQTAALLFECHPQEQSLLQGISNRRRAVGREQGRIAKTPSSDLQVSSVAPK